MLHHATLLSYVALCCTALLRLRYAARFEVWDLRFEGGRGSGEAEKFNEVEKLRVGWRGGV
jgi:hypothetical protein